MIASSPPTRVNAASATMARNLDMEFLLPSMPGCIDGSDCIGSVYKLYYWEFRLVGRMAVCGTAVQLASNGRTRAVGESGSTV